MAKLVHYSGRVQGVGFRYTTCRIASRFDVVGHVKNLPDGRVEVLAQGETPEVQEFLAVIEREMGRYVREVRTLDVSLTPNCTDFNVAF